MRVYRYLIASVILVAVAVVLCYVFVFWQVDLSQHHWCDALVTLTQHPVPKPANPAGNPSRVEGYNLYTEFVRLKGDFGC